MRFLLPLVVFLNTSLFARGLLISSATKESLRLRARQDVQTRVSGPQVGQIAPRATITRYTDIRAFPEGPSVPMSASDQQTVNEAIQQARLIGRGILSLRRGDALYARIMGDPEFENYHIVMQQVRRVVNILGGAGDDLPGGERQEDIVDNEFIFLRDSRARNRGDGTDSGHVAATTRGRVIILYDTFFAQYPTLGHVFPPGAERDLNSPVLLDRAADSRPAIMFHELLHAVSHGQRQLDQIINRASNAGAVIRGIITNPPRITDVRLNSFRPAQDDVNGNQRDAEVTEGIDTNARAYRSDLTSRLASLTYGRYAAALNADSITILGIAALVNFANNNFHPSGSGPFPPDPPNMPTQQHSIHNDEEFLRNSMLGLSQNRPIRGSLNYIDKVADGWLHKDHGGL